MNSRLTWRDVSTPDFGNASRGVVDAGRLIQESIGQGIGAIGAFDQAKSDAINKQILFGMSQTPDAKALQAAITSGVVGGVDISDNLRRVSGETLGLMSPAKMTELATNQTNLASNQLRLGQDQINADQRANLDAQGGLWGQALMLAAKGDEAGALKILEGVNLPGIGYTNANKLFSDVQSTQSSGISNRTNQNTLNNTIEDRNDQTLAQAAVQQILESAGDVEGARSLFFDPNSFVSRLNPRAKALVQAQLSQSFPGLFADTGSSVSGSAAGGASGAGAILAPVSGDIGAFNYTGTGVRTGPGSPTVYDKPQQEVAAVLSQGTVAGKPISDVVIAGALGNFHVEGGYGGALGDNKSASGIAQWRGERRNNFRAMFKKDPHEATYAEQAQFIVWELNNPGKAGMTVEGRNAILNARTPEEAAALWEKHYERSAGHHNTQRQTAAVSIYDTLRRARNAGSSLSVRQMQDDPSGLTTALAQTIKAPNRPAAVVAAELVGPNGAFKGTSRGFMVDQLDKIIQQTGVNADTAAAILIRNQGGSKEKPWWDVVGNIVQTAGRLTGTSTPNLAGNVSIRDSGVRSDVKRIKQFGGTNGILNQISAQQSRADVQAQLEAAKQQLAAAQDAYTRMAVRARTQPGVQRQLPRLAEQLNAAKQQVALLTSMADSNQNQPR